MTDLRVSNTYRSASSTQSLRVIVVMASPAGRYSFVLDQDSVFTSMRVDAAASLGDRWVVLEADDVEKLNMRVEPGQTTVTAGPVTASNGQTVSVYIRGTSAAAAITITSAGTTPTQYRLLSSVAAPSRWRMIGGTWTPVSNEYRFVATQPVRTRVHRRVSGSWLKIAD